MSCLVLGNCNIDLDLVKKITCRKGICKIIFHDGTRKVFKRNDNEKDYENVRLFLKRSALNTVSKGF